MKNDKLHARMSVLSTKELIKIVTLRSEDYEPEAIEAARYVLSSRTDAMQEDVVQVAVKEEQSREKSYRKVVRNERNDALLAGLFVILILMGIGFVGLGVSGLFETEFPLSMGESIITIGIGILIFGCAYLVLRYRKRRKALASALEESLENVKLA